MHALSCFLADKPGRATVHRACCTKKAPGIGHSTYHYVLDTQDGKQWNLKLQRIVTAPQMFVGKIVVSTADEALGCWPRGHPARNLSLSVPSNLTTRSMRYQTCM